VQNVSEYVDYAEEWAKASGSGEVTRKMLDHINRMRPDDRARVDAALRGPAGELERWYRKTADKSGQRVREDLMNLLGILRDRGLDGAQEALNSKAFLPGLIGAVLLPAALRRPPAEQNAQDRTQ
jgi:hypothetical protein